MSAAPVGTDADGRTTEPPPQAASSAAALAAATQPATRRPERIQCSFLMEAAMSDLFDEYPMLIFALESLLALALLIAIVMWTVSGKRKKPRDERSRG